MSKSIYVVCDSNGNPFFTDIKGKDVYQRVWGFKNKDEAIAGKNPPDTIVEFRPSKRKDK